MLYMQYVDERAKEILTNFTILEHEIYDYFSCNTEYTSELKNEILKNDILLLMENDFNTLITESLSHETLLIPIGDDRIQDDLLRYSSCYGNIEKINNLLEFGAIPNLSNKYGWNALMYACMYGHYHIVERLLFYGADINSINICQMSALKLAIEYRQTHIVNLLIEKGAK